MGAADVERFRSHLANDRHVTPATHRQALSALLYLYREVLDVDLPWMQELDRPAMRKRIPAVLTVDEVEDQLREAQNSDFIEGKAVHLFQEITAILDFMPAGHGDEDEETEKSSVEDEDDDLPEVEEGEEEKLKGDSSLKWDEDEEGEDKDKDESGTWWVCTPVSRRPGQIVPLDFAQRTPYT